MPLRSIAAIFKAADGGGSPCEHVGAVVRGQLECVEEQQLVRLTGLKAELTALQRRLEAAPTATSEDYRICPCLEGLPGSGRPDKERARAIGRRAEPA